MASIQIATPFNIALDFELADLHKRIFAYGVDLLIIVAYAWIMGNLVYDDNITEFGNNNTGLSILLISVPILFYSLICELAMHGQTIGKKIFDIGNGI